MLVRKDTLTPWQGERLPVLDVPAATEENPRPSTSILPPPNLEEIGSESDWEALGLAKAVPFTPPPGYRPVGPASYELVGDQVHEVYAVELMEPERRLVSKAAIIDRLQAAGLLETARAAMDAADLYVRERWNSRAAVYADDPTTLAFLQGIGADPEVILAPEL